MFKKRRMWRVNRFILNLDEYQSIYKHISVKTFSSKSGYIFGSDEIVGST